MSKKTKEQGKYNPMELVKEIGPFERAENNLKKFAWNAMIAHATQLAVDSLEAVGDKDTKDAEITRLTAELTLQSIAFLLADKDEQGWN